MTMGVLRCSRDLLQSSLSIIIIIQLQFFRGPLCVICRMVQHLPREYASLMSIAPEFLRHTVSINSEKVPIGMCGLALAQLELRLTCGIGIES